jgi:hypothetical protein
MRIKVRGEKRNPLCLIRIKAARRHRADTRGMNTAAVSAPSLRPTSPWRDVVLPREHGSWSLALEPLALGLLVAPSAPGGCLAVATLAGFLARRPLKIALRERDVARRATAITALACAARLRLVRSAAPSPPVGRAGCPGSRPPWCSVEFLSRSI